VKRLFALLLAAVVVAGAAVFTLEPNWYLRARYPLQYQEIVQGHARNYNLPPDLVAAVIYAESKFDANARSPSGAVGLMQLLPATAKGIALRTGGHRFVTADLLDPEINIRYGCWYLRHLLDKYDDERLALAAYNAGQANVDRWVDEQRAEIPFAETRHYVDRIEKLKRVYREAYAAQLGARQPPAALSDAG
jgi:soluble lytic murein transglycosylase